MAYITVEQRDKLRELVRTNLPADVAPELQDAVEELLERVEWANDEALHLEAQLVQAEARAERAERALREIERAYRPSAFREEAGKGSRASF